jgi:hypothetical protein
MDLTGILDKIQLLIPIVLQVVGAFALIATLTPNKVDDRIAQVIMDVVNFLGANIGKAKNNNP